MEKMSDHFNNVNIGNDNLPFPSAAEVGREFVRQYYTKWSCNLSDVHMFYGNESVFWHDGHEATGQENIQKTVNALEYNNCKARIHSVNSLYSADDSLILQVFGELSSNGGTPRKFVQSFVLCKQMMKKYYVQSDIFQWVDKAFYTEFSAKKANFEPAAPPEPVVKEVDVPKNDQCANLNTEETFHPEEPVKPQPIVTPQPLVQKHASPEQPKHQDNYPKTWAKAVSNNSAVNNNNNSSIVSQQPAATVGGVAELDANLKEQVNHVDEENNHNGPRKSNFKSYGDKRNSNEYRGHFNNGSSNYQNRFQNRDGGGTGQFRGGNRNRYSGSGGNNRSFVPHHQGGGSGNNTGHAGVGGSGPALNSNNRFSSSSGNRYSGGSGGGPRSGAGGGHRFQGPPHHNNNSTSQHVKSGAQD